MYEEKSSAPASSDSVQSITRREHEIGSDDGAKHSDALPSMSVSISDVAESHEIDRLRKLAYSTAVNFELPDPQTVEWRNDPPGSVCISVKSGPHYAATMRLSIASNRQVARRLLEGQAPDEADFYPSIILGRGATAPEFRGLGLMGFLVAAGVRVAELAGLPSAVAVQIAGTPHFRAMEAAGWTGTIIGQDNLRVVDSQNALMLVSIGKNRFQQNNQFSQHKYPQLHKMLRPEPLLREAALKIEKALPVRTP